MGGMMRWDGDKKGCVNVGSEWEEVCVKRNAPQPSVSQVPEPDRGLNTEPRQGSEINQIYNPSYSTYHGITKPLVSTVWEGRG